MELRDVMRNGFIYGTTVMGRGALVMLELVVTYYNSQALNSSKELRKLNFSQGVLGLSAICRRPPMSNLVYTQETTSDW